MPRLLLPCANCARHVRSTAKRCPFCAVEGAVLTALAAVVTACGSPSPPPTGATASATSAPARPSEAAPPVARDVVTVGADVVADVVAPVASAVAPSAAATAPNARATARPRRARRPREEERDQPLYGVPDYKEGEVLAHHGPPPGSDDEGY